MLAETELQAIEKPNCHIMRLPEDLVRQLFRYLPELCDKVRLASTASKFRLAFEDWARVRRNELVAEDVEMMRLPDIIDFFSIAGPFIKVLHVDCASFQKESLLVEFMAEFCKNIEEINFTNVTDDFHYHALLARLTKLRRVSIDCMDAEDVLNFNLQGNRDLESFELINGCYTGKHLCGFPKLQSLVLRDCLLWNSGEFGIPLKTLRSLDLDNCCFEVMNQSLYHKIAECCVQLEELSFSGCDTNFEVIAQLCNCNLQRCTLKTWMTSNELNIGFLSTLAEKKGNNLSYLKLAGQFQITNEHARYVGQLSSLKELHWSTNDVLDDDHFKFFNDLSGLEVLGLFWCGHVTDIGLMRMVRKCMKLKRIDLKECDEVTDQFVLNAIAWLGKSSGRALVLNVDGTKIKQSLLSHADYLAPQNNVKLVFTNVKA
ncbi:F-box/LRR-repeat protein 14 [Scaptodrosophila lebanonensis]|uniref:F-box/LRR-repeat protein 14 n=1 Tax=Drosophila lebanonensis TaxID=7225 RepID=A0A6J2T1S7_DROLE|nr:F-box/LRR-repeat protein 14 [Scaptodrosophila lebanonensis]